MKAATILVIITCSFLVISSSNASDYKSDGVDNATVEWQILTKDNFTSQIRLHRHLLLFVTVPWCGESRLLMKELSQTISHKKDEFGAVKLMVIFRNNDRMLANVLGVREGITIMYYRDAVSYKYRGRLRATTVLSFVYSVMSMLQEELPLKSLKTPEDVQEFLDSTDKGVLLFEFCRWTPMLLAKGKNNFTEDAHGKPAEDHVEQSFSGGTSKTVTSRGKEQQKGSYNEKLMCAVENGVLRIPWLGKFSHFNDSAPIVETDNMSSDVGLSCNFEEFQHFDSFFTKFITLARELFFPPERQKFGLISERSLGPSIGINGSGSWFVMLHFAGCPGCSKILKEGDDLKSFLQMRSPLVNELVDDLHDLAPIVPAHMPSILLFVDRSSVSSAIRERSKDALDVFRELALNYQILDHIGGDNEGKPEMFSAQAFQSCEILSGHPKLRLSRTTKKSKANDKMSIMVLSEGKLVSLDNIASDLEGKSLHDILAQILQQKKETKLSSFAQELGFQLLSDDMNIKVEDIIQSATGFQSNQLSPELIVESLSKSSEDSNQAQSHGDSSSSVMTGRTSKPTAELFHEEGEKTTYVGIDGTIVSVEPGQFLGNHEPSTARNLLAEEKEFSEVDKIGEQQLYFQSFRGSFFFSDGGYRLLGALTSGSKIPSVIIIDPNSQQHYAFPEDLVFNYSSLVDFVGGFSNGSLIPYQRSESVLASSREAANPPFVNLDFHEMNSIPRITARMFSDLMFGINQSEPQNTSNPRKKDMLVLFSNSWCGFCQRMELVVREVHRALKGYVNVLKNNMEDDGLKLPLIYVMDCILNECSTIIKSLGQREVYPALILFPAKRKGAVSYVGDITVSEIVRFIAERGSNSHHLIGDNGVLRTKIEMSTDFHKDSLSIRIQEEALVSKDNYKKVLLKNRLPTSTPKYNWIPPSTSNDIDETSHITAGSILIATEKLLNIHPFEESVILIVKDNHDNGFLGLIVNKHINWDSLQELEKESELVKEAPLSFGGPVRRLGMPLVCLVKKFIRYEYPEVLPGIYFLNQIDTIHEIKGIKTGNHSAANFWFFLGCSSWGWEQLFHEIREGAWNVTNNTTGRIIWP